MLIFSIYLTVIFLFTKVESENAISSKYKDSAPIHLEKNSLFSANDIYVIIKKISDSFLNKEPLLNRTKSPNKKASGRYWNSTSSNEKLSPAQLQHFVEESKKQVQLALKKSRWKEANQQIIIQNNKHQEEEDLEYQDTLNQLNELYDLQNAAEEYEDEQNDAEIFRAIYTSVMEYKKSWATRFFKRFLSSHVRVKRDEEVVCYKDLGCFRDEGPFNYFDMLPNSPEEINTQFILHTKENPKREQFLTYTNTTTILQSNFRATRKTIVIIHGFGSSCHRIWVRHMRETFLKMEDVNVICVQWEEGASTPNYVRASSNTRLVGAQVAVFLDACAKVANLSLDNVHLVGFSLGAHVSGYAGQRLKGIGRISGLDPAGPLFESFPPNMRLDDTDAKFVDVIHTNADSLLRGGLGAYEPMGHVDFYPNGGRVQRGCTNLFVGGFTDILWPKEGDGRYLCNHRRGYKYFMESVVPICKYPAFACRDYETFLKGDCFPCKDCGNMGFYADKSPGRGMMFLDTRETEPFCANQYKIEIWHSGGPPTTDSVSTQGRFDVTFVAHDGKNETINVTRDTGKKMHAGSRTVVIIVLHAALSIISNLQVRYTSYRGWISSGFNRWAIDKISIMSSSGKIQSFCHRGLTMESGQTKVFPLVHGDCNPRELTLHPLPLPWPGVDYKIQNGAHVYQPQTSNPALAVGPAYNYNTTNEPQYVHHTFPSRSRPRPVQPVKAPPPPSRPQNDITSTLTEPYDQNAEILNITISEIRLNKTANATTLEPQVELNTTLVAIEPDFNATYRPMTKDEYLAWRDAPPPNLQQATGKPGDDSLNTGKPEHSSWGGGKIEENSRNTGTIEDPTTNTNNNVPKERKDVTFKVNTHPLKDSSHNPIREDAQVPDHHGSIDNTVIETNKKNGPPGYDYYSFIPETADEIDNTKSEHQDMISESRIPIQKQSLKFSEKGDIDTSLKVSEDVPFNSVIDVPYSNRDDRSLKSHSNVNLNSDERKKTAEGTSKGYRVTGDNPNHELGVISGQEPIKDHRDETREQFQQDFKSDTFSTSHSLHKPSKFENGQGQFFSYEDYSLAAPQSHNSPDSKELHTKPPTVLRPPGLISEYQASNANTPYQAGFPARFTPPVKATGMQYSDLYAQHHYYPRPGVHEVKEDFSESAHVPVYDTRQSLYIKEPSHPSFFPQQGSLHSSYPVSPPPQKPPKRSFNLLTLFFSLGKSNDGPPKSMPQGIYRHPSSQGKSNDGPPKRIFFSNDQPPLSESRLHHDRIPYLAPQESLTNVQHFRRLALPTHLRPPRVQANLPHPNPTSRGVGRRLKVGDARDELGITMRAKEKTIKRDPMISKSKAFPSSEFLEPKQGSYPPLRRDFLLVRNRKFIPIRVSRKFRRRRKPRETLNQKSK